MSKSWVCPFGSPNPWEHGHDYGTGNSDDKAWAALSLVGHIKEKHPDEWALLQDADRLIERAATP